MKFQVFAIVSTLMVLSVYGAPATSEDKQAEDLLNEVIAEEQQTKEGEWPSVDLLAAMNRSTKFLAYFGCWCPQINATVVKEYESEQSFTVPEGCNRIKRPLHSLSPIVTISILLTENLSKYEYWLPRLPQST